MIQRAHRIVFPLAALLAVLPILVHGPSCGHDFDFHLLSWLEAATQFAHAGWPHWAYTPAWNAGEPRFIFYPPLSWTLGGLLGLALPWTLVPAVFTWICLTLSGLTAYRLTSRYAGHAAATLAATLYMLNPYMLFTAYERTAYGELLAAAFVPLLFRAALAERVRLLDISVAVTLLWLTNAPAAVMGSYALAFVTIVRLLQHEDALKGQRAGYAGKITAGTLLGRALASVYILPAAYERRFVQVEMAVTTGMRVSDHFLFHRMPGHSADDDFHDAVVRSASTVALLLFTGIAAMGMMYWRKAAALKGLKSSPITPLALLAALITFLLTPPSAFLWKVLPQLHFLQFPWRLCALRAVILSVFFAMTIRVSLTPALTAVSALILAGALITPAWILFHQTCDAEDAVPARVALFHSNLGTEPTDEYTPVDADPDALRAHDPPWWVVERSRPIDDPAPIQTPPGQAPNHLTLHVAAPEYLVLNRRSYPAWETILNGTPVDTRAGPQRADGLIVVPLLPGDYTVDLRLVHTPDEIAGIGISVLAFGVACGVGYRSRSRAA